METPYQFTIVYDSTSLLETAIAFLTDQAQLVTDPLTCEHISPELLLFGENYTVSQIQEMKMRGYNVIHIFAYDKIAARQKYADILEKELANNNSGSDTAAEYITLDSSSDGRIVIFDNEDKWDHLRLISGVTAANVIEYISAYASLDDSTEINSDKLRRAIHIVTALNVLYGNNEIGPSLLKICSVYRGHDILEELIAQGKLLCSILHDLTTNLMKSAEMINTPFGKVAAVNIQLISIINEAVLRLDIPDEAVALMIYYTNRQNWTIAMTSRPENEQEVMKWLGVERRPLIKHVSYADAEQYLPHIYCKK